MILEMYFYIRKSVILNWIPLKYDEKLLWNTIEYG